MTVRKLVLVTENAEELDAVSAAVRNAGFEIETAIVEISTIFGSAEESQLDVIRHVPGVVSVEEERIVELANPDGNGPF